VNERRTYVVAYDIRAPRRLQRVHRAMTRLGHPLQYSVFAADFTPAEKAAALRRLGKLIDASADDVRLYAVPAHPFGAWRGPSLVPSAVSLASGAAATLADRLQRRPFAANGARRSRDPWR
jgi:CRISPR-associated protein Cas2